MLEELEGAFRKDTDGIEVAVIPEPIEQFQEKGRKRYAFSYSIKIHNGTDSPAKLMRRWWKISSGGKPFTEVKGDGVVGLQPLIRPGETFSYSSSVVIEEPVGSMEGTYYFERKRGKPFEVAIPLFPLIFESALQ